MGIYDRDYIRDGSRSGRSIGMPRLLSFNGWLILSNVAVFLLTIVAARAPVAVYFETRLNQTIPATATLDVEPVYRDSQMRPVSSLRGMRVPGEVYRFVFVRGNPEPVGIEVHRLHDPVSAFGYFSTWSGFFGIEMWRFVTFQFLHANWVHLAMNMFGLWVFGGIVESQLGFKKYAAFYLVCGIFGAVGYLALNFLGAGLGLQLPGLLFDNLRTPLVGASAGVFGVIMACAYIAPQERVILILLPVPLRLWMLAYGYVAIAAFNLLSGGRNAGGDAAHIGGAVAGYFFIRNSHLLRDFFDIFGDSRKPPARGDDREVDRILDKTRAEGIGSLTEAERETLRRETERQRRP